MWDRYIILVESTVGFVHCANILMREMSCVLFDRGATKRVLGIKDTITHLHRFVEFEAPHPKRRSGVVAHEKGSLEATVIEGRVRHEFTLCHYSLGAE